MRQNLYGNASPVIGIEVVLSSEIVAVLFDELPTVSCTSPVVVLLAEPLVVSFSALSVPLLSDLSELVPVDGF